MDQKTLTISKEADGSFVVDDHDLPGSPHIGRGKTIEAAIGSWFIGNSTRLSYLIKSDETAHRSVEDYNARKRKKRRT